jgi:glutamate dehydrogenase
MPQPSPLFEIFVYGIDVEGIHLRGGRVARGGIRWSTRKEDYRTEVLGLMKAQMTKNAVIVPTGAKGGFVLRNPPADAAEMREAVRDGYTTFIRGLLDVTDNLVDGAVIHPPGVRVHDEGDPYLVVAADKGTATFSDIANEIAASYDFWLGDAFASGGSAGYDHKQLGITARGAWESVKWHFQELDVDVMSDLLTVVGIGDMSGDVFGNGMLLSPTIKLVAAFDHRHIFLDPDPDPAASHAERARLFDLTRSSWEDYNPALISEGGGVFSRSEKRIELSPEVRSAMAVEGEAMTPDELIQAVLRAPVDLLWNGGIGTFVKASTESHESVGDRVAEPYRVDARELRCRVIGEGGNLGLTQAGRIEFASRGGRVNTDFIDNAGGVHCSDREVNLKILLGLAESHGDLDRAGRDRLITDVVDDVVEAILYENFLQAQILAQEADASAHRLEAYEDLMVLLEGDGTLNRAIEGLPSTDEMNERARISAGMTTPELSVLLAYAKRSLRDWLLESDLPDWEDSRSGADEYFPPEVVERFGPLIVDHPLRRELVATVVANRVVDSEGVTFVTRLMAETGAAPEQVVRAYQIARAVVDAPERWSAVEDLVGALPVDVGRELMRGVDGLVESVARWYLTNPTAERMSEIIGRSAVAITELAQELPQIGPREWLESREADAAAWVELGVPSEVARRHVYQEELVHAPDMVDVAFHTGRSVRDVAKLFLLVGPAFEIDWLEHQAKRLPAANRWHRRANQTLQDDLVLLRRQLSERILEESPDAEPAEALDHYLVARTQALGRLTRFMRSLAVDGVDDVASVVVALRQIRALTV